MDFPASSPSTAGALLLPRPQARFHQDSYKRGSSSATRCARRTSCGKRSPGLDPQRRSLVIAIRHGPPSAFVFCVSRARRNLSPGRSSRRTVPACQVLWRRATVGPAPRNRPSGPLELVARRPLQRGGVAPPPAAFGMRQTAGTVPVTVTPLQNQRKVLVAAPTRDSMAPSIAPTSLFCVLRRAPPPQSVDGGAQLLH